MKKGVKVFIKNEVLGKYLFILRDNNPTIAAPNCWSLVGGGVEGNETPSEALGREVIEEVNIPLFDLRLIYQMITEENVNGEVSLVYKYIFFAKTNAVLNDINLAEGQEASFFTLDEIVCKEDVCIKLKELILNHRDIIEQPKLLVLEGYKKS